MDNNVINMKELNINGKTYAKYEMVDTILFLKVIIQIVEGKGNEGKSEDLLIHIIQLIEKRMFHQVAYLNV